MSMSERRKTLYARINAVLLRPEVIAAVDFAAEAKEIADMAIAMARVTSCLEVQDGVDDGEPLEPTA